MLVVYSSVVSGSLHIYVLFSFIHMCCSIAYTNHSSTEFYLAQLVRCVQVTEVALVVFLLKSGRRGHDVYIMQLIIIFKVISVI